MSSHPIIDLLDVEEPRLAPGPRVVSADSVRQVHRQRLIAGFAKTAAQKGYWATTVGDVVASASVSKRTFYEQFDDLQACFLAAYDSFSDLVIGLIARAVEDSRGAWRDRIAVGVRAYLEVLSQERDLTRVFLVEILGAGGMALRRRRAVHERFADLLEDLVRRHRAELPAGYRLDSVMAQALVGAINELVLIAIERDRGCDLPQLEGTAGRLVSAVLATGMPD